LILSGSWDGHVRVWKLSDDKKRIEPAGILGMPSGRDSPEFNGVSEDSDDQPKVNGSHVETQPPWSVKGIINDISVCERGERGKDGLCVVIAVGKEHRLGNWKKVPGAKNGAYVFEVPRIEKTAITNGDDTKSGEGL
jgi:ribosomal RNA-processing protein 9